MGRDEQLDRFVRAIMMTRGGASLVSLDRLSPIRLGGLAGDGMECKEKKRGCCHRLQLLDSTTSRRGKPGLCAVSNQRPRALCAFRELGRGRMGGRPLAKPRRANGWLSCAREMDTLLWLSLFKRPDGMLWTSVASPHYSSAGPQQRAQPLRLFPRQRSHPIHANAPASMAPGARPAAVGGGRGVVALVRVGHALHPSSKAHVARRAASHSTMRWHWPSAATRTAKMTPTRHAHTPTPTQVDQLPSLRVVAPPPSNKDQFVRASQPPS